MEQVTDYIWKRASDYSSSPVPAGRRVAFFTGLKKVTKERTSAALGICACRLAVLLLMMVGDLLQ